MVEITADFPVNLQDTKANLKAAAAGEHEETTILYPQFAKVAEEEGFPAIKLQYSDLLPMRKQATKKIFEIVEKHRNRQSL